MCHWPCVVFSSEREGKVSWCLLLALWCSRGLLFTVCCCTQLVARFLQQCGFHFFIVKHKPYVLGGCHTLITGVSIISDVCGG